jgi:hypothetical protein
VPGDAGLPADSLYRGVPQLTAVDPSLQHANSTDRVFFGHDRGEEAGIPLLAFLETKEVAPIQVWRERVERL